VTRRSSRLLAAVLLGTVAGVVGVTAPAHAAACPPGTGVTVVVNGGVRCDADGGTGERASRNFADAGHTLSYASRSGGFVCRVDGAPADDPCTDASPADAYWALFWSDGTSGAWAYSSLGVGALRVPSGGAVAFVFQNSSTRRSPSVPAPVAAPPPPRETAGSPDSGSTTAKPRKRKPGASATPGTAATTAPVAAVPTSAPTTSASPTPSPSATTATPTPGATAPTATWATEDAVGAADPVETAGTASDGTSAAALAVGTALLLVLAAAGAVVWHRRRGA